MGEIRHGPAHHAEADEEHSEAGQDSADSFKRLFLGEKGDEGSDAGEGREQDCRRDRVASEHTEGDDLGSDCRTDIGAVDYRGRLGQRHDPCIHETDDHDGRGS